MQKIIQYIKDTKTEMHNVVWPKVSTAFVHTGVVITIALVIGYLSNIFDGVFKLGIKTLFGL
jgi:preprotein translocase SecE subunit